MTLPFGALEVLSGFGQGLASGLQAQQDALAQARRCQQSSNAGFFNHAAAVDADNAIKKVVGNLPLREQLQAEVDEWLPTL